MSQRKFKVLLTGDPDDKVWVTYVPALDWTSTFGETREEALANTHEAIEGWLEAAGQEGIPVPEDDAESEWVEVEVLAS